MRVDIILVEGNGRHSSLIIYFYSIFSFHFICIRCKIHIFIDEFIHSFIHKSESD